jgi:hypothetical protein
MLPRLFRCQRHHTCVGSIVLAYASACQGGRVDIDWPALRETAVGLTLCAEGGPRELGTLLPLAFAGSDITAGRDG